MKIDLHIHSKDCSDGKMTLSEIFKEAHHRGIKVISITDHDSIECQETARALADRYDIQYITGVELSISFSHPRYRNSKPIPLDMLGYEYDIHNLPLRQKLEEMREYRRKRAEQILEKINQELLKGNLEAFTNKDLEAIEETVDGAFGRPHIADYMVKKGIVSNKQAAFDRYLVKCNVPKMPVSLEEASNLIRGAGGKLVHAHPSDPNGTSLVALTRSLEEQHQIIRETMLPYLDGVECWHTRHNAETRAAYLEFARQEGLIVTGGSDCHQQPVIMGTIDIPSYVAEQFGL
ncbi:MAG: PHP domain-containing protein [Deltaproteobacteria bacterium]|nr:PHP domain-containing protein [Deltaproteobacteria bacterium]